MLTARKINPSTALPAVMWSTTVAPSTLDLACSDSTISELHRNHASQIGLENANAIYDDHDKARQAGGADENDDDRSILMSHFCRQHNVEPQCIRMLGSTMKSHVEGIVRQEKYIHTPPMTSYVTRYWQSTQTIR
jgi:hypothetical protein